MAPLLARDALTMSDYLEAQWANPSDILSVLLLLGPDIVQRAVAQLAGRVITPVAFSFGWVAYAATALLSTVGDGRLMPDADMANTLVIGAASGHVRATKSWVLGRLLRDLDSSVDDEMKNEAAHVPPSATILEEQPEKSQPPQQQPTPLPGGKEDWEALRVTVFEVQDDPTTPHGVPTLDWVWYSGILVIFVQLGISAIPWALNDNWSIFMIAAAGNLLALAGASLPQWRHEKWACPNTGGATITITQGNGSRTAATILGKRGVGLDLEILAQGTRTAQPSRFTRIATALLAILWILLLITVAGIRQNTWYLLGIGLLGSVQNVVAAGAFRRPESHGLHINKVETLRGLRVAKVLRDAEARYPSVGTSLLDVFFPGSLRVKDPADIEFWRAALDGRKKPNKYGVRLDALSPPDNN